MGRFPRQRFTLSEVWQLPIGRGRAIGGDMNAALDALVGGWQLSTIWTARSGLPVNVSLAGNGVDPTTGLAYSFLNRNGGALRPNQVGDPTRLGCGERSLHLPQSGRVRAAAAQHAGQRNAQLRLGARVLHSRREPGEALRPGPAICRRADRSVQRAQHDQLPEPERDLGLVDFWRHQRCVCAAGRPAGDSICVLTALPRLESNHDGILSVGCAPSRRRRDRRDARRRLVGVNRDRHRSRLARGSCWMRTTRIPTTGSSRTASIARSRPAHRWPSNRTWSGGRMTRSGRGDRSCRTASPSTAANRRCATRSSSASVRWSSGRSKTTTVARGRSSSSIST